MDIKHNFYLVFLTIVKKIKRYFETKSQGIYVNAYLSVASIMIVMRREIMEILVPM